MRAWLYLLAAAIAGAIVTTPALFVLILLGGSFNDALVASLATLMLAAGIAVVTMRDIIRCGLAMIVCFLALAGLYVTLGAAMVAAAQVIVYIGAISVLILFAIMLTQAGDASLPAPFHRQAPIAVVIALVVVGLVAWAVVTTAWKAAPTAAAVVIEAIGNLLFTDYALPFEIIGFLLLAAIIGAIFLARRPEEDERAN